LIRAETAILSFLFFFEGAVHISGRHELASEMENIDAV
jgi:hypothetical protein